MASTQELTRQFRDRIGEARQWIGEHGREGLETFQDLAKAFRDGSIHDREEEAKINAEYFMSFFCIQKKLQLNDKGAEVMSYILQRYWLGYKNGQDKLVHGSTDREERTARGIDRLLATADVIKAGITDLGAWVSHENLGSYSLTQLGVLAKKLIDPWMECFALDPEIHNEADQKIRAILKPYTITSPK